FRRRRGDAAEAPTSVQPAVEQVVDTAPPKPLKNTSARPGRSSNQSKSRGPQGRTPRSRGASKQAAPVGQFEDAVAFEVDNAVAMETGTESAARNRDAGQKPVASGR